MQQSARNDLRVSGSTGARLLIVSLDPYQFCFLADGIIESMNIPDLPTDNLYKFIALAGLILLLFSSIYYQVFSRDVLLKNIDLRAEMSRMEKEVEFLREDTDSLKEDKQAIKQDNSVSQEEQNNVGKNIEGLNQRTREAILKTIELERIGKGVLIYNDQIALLRWSSIIGAITGILLLIIGFYLWYTRIQIYQDKILVNEAQKNTKPE